MLSFLSMPAHSRTHYGTDRPLSNLLTRLVASVCLVVAMTGSAASQQTVPSADFPLPASLEPAVEFWKLVFAGHTSDEVILHDDRHLDVIYGTVSALDLRAGGASDVKVEVARRKRAEKALLGIRRALQGDRRASAEHREMVEKAWAAAGKTPDSGARHRVRSQLGLKNRFAEAIEISGMFIPEIKEILERNGVPTEVAYLPFVESMFNYKARSKVGASGAWQFTRATGRLFLRIDEAVDERSDVLHAADGAARMLRKDYERIEAWPLALTGYNHGAAGMRRAARRLGTKDIGVIVRKYRSRTFGFASRNFYAEFLAVVQIYQNRERYFPGVEPRPRLRYDEFTGDRYYSLLDLALLLDVPSETLADLNPGLSRLVANGTLLVPKGYTIRVPQGARQASLAAYGKIPTQRKLSRQLAFEYRVRSGDTLGKIAARHRTSVRALQSANNLPRADRIYIGQRLRIPSSSGFGKRMETLTLADLEKAAAAESAPTLAEDKTYRVRSGDTLGRIAEREGTTVRALMAANRLGNTIIRVGQVLRIPSS
ncbi:MAG: LysM peptidoglycan-binding domain-containing protein [Acidobacteriota bacterium]